VTYQYLDEEQVRKGRLMLWIALAGSVVMIPALFSSKLIVLFMVAWVASFFGGLGGIREVARGTGGSALLMYAALVAVFMPILNIAVIAAYLLRANRALRGGELAEPEPEPAPRRPAQPAQSARPAPAPGAAAAVAASQWSQQRIKLGGPTAYVSSAIACIKQAGLRSNAGGGDLEEGSRLGMRFTLPDGAPPMKPEDEPIMRVAHGNFGVAYLVDLGDHYTWVTVGELAAAGMTLDALHAAGIANLARKAQDLAVMEGDRAQMLAMGGEFEASLMLVDTLWEKGGALAAYVPNGAIAAIPARDVLAFCDARSKPGLDAVRKVAANPLPDPRHALTTRLFARRGGRWQVLGEPAAKPKDLPPLEFR
jgi:hypothetical protein